MHTAQLPFGYCCIVRFDVVEAVDECCHSSSCVSFFLRLLLRLRLLLFLILLSISFLLLVRVVVFDVVDVVAPDLFQC